MSVRRKNLRHSWVAGREDEWKRRKSANRTMHLDGGRDAFQIRLGRCEFSQASRCPKKTPRNLGRSRFSGTFPRIGGSKPTNDGSGARGTNRRRVPLWAALRNKCGMGKTTNPVVDHAS